MKKLLVSACFVLAIVLGCKDKEAKNVPAGQASQGGDSVGVMALSSTLAKEMIKHYKSNEVGGNREKLFKGGVNIPRMDSILNGANSFNIFAAAYPSNYTDSLKRNMPTFILQVRRTTASAEGEILYYAIDRESLCPPPPDCRPNIEAMEY